MLRLLLAYSRVHVIVNFIERKEAIAVEVGLAGLQSVNQGVGEDRAGVGVFSLFAFKGILQGVGSREYDASLAVQLVASAGTTVPFGEQALFESTTVAAVQHQDLPSRAAAAHHLVHEMC